MNASSGSGMSLSTERRRLLELMRERRGHTLPSADIIPRRGGDETPVISFSQERLWSLAQADAAHPVWRVCQAVGLHGRLDPPALCAALDSLVARHEVLRTGYVAVNEGIAPVIKPTGCFPLRLVETDAGASRERDALLEHHVTEEMREPFDLKTAPLIRGRLLRLSDYQNLLLVVVHRMIYDGWSRGVLVRDLAALYADHRGGAANPPPALETQYADFALWQRRRLMGHVLRRGLDHWIGHLAGSPTVLELPTDRPRPPVRSYAGEGLPVLLDARLSAGLRALARSQGGTLFMALYAGWVLLLSRLSGQNDIVVGMPVANRQRSELEGLIGCFANVVALRTQLYGYMTVRELLSQIRNTTLAGHAYQWVPFSAVLDAVSPPTGPRSSPACQVLINLINTPQSVVHMPGFTLTPLVTPTRTTEYELSLVLVEQDETIVGGLVYASELFNRDTVERWVAAYHTILASMVRDPERSVNAVMRREL